MKDLIIKGITLITFFSLIGGFVAYRAGFFGKQNKALQLSPNGSVLNAQQQGVQEHLDSIPKRTIMSSSKSMILTDEELIIKDSNSKEELDSIRKLNRLKRMMGSSKSGAIFEPGPEELLEIDSISILEMEIMGGSKSGMIFGPEYEIKSKDSETTGRSKPRRFLKRKRHSQQKKSN